MFYYFIIGIEENQPWFSSCAKPTAVVHFSLNLTNTIINLSFDILRKSSLKLISCKGPFTWDISHQGRGGLSQIQICFLTLKREIWPKFVIGGKMYCCFYPHQDMGLFTNDVIFLGGFWTPLPLIMCK